MQSLFTISDQQRSQYRDEGYFVLENAIPDDYLDTLRRECQAFIDQMNAEMDRAGTDTIGINHRNRRYFIGQPSIQSASIRSIYYSELFAEICRSTIGAEVFGYYEQYVVKAAERGMRFSWHQDSAFGEVAPHPPYVTCWCALDDMTAENGTVYLLPYSRAGSRELVPHIPEDGTNDLVGYSGDDPGQIVQVPAGSIAVFSSHVLHRSGVNTTDRMRRVYLAQYAPVVMRSAETGEPWGRNEPFLEAGRIVGG